MSIEFRHAAKAAEVSKALDVLEQSLGRDAAEYFSRLYDFAAYRQDWVQVAVHGSRVVGTLGVAPRQTRMGVSVWQTAVLMPLVTSEGQPPEVAQGLVQQALQYARANGCSAATVLGDPGLYATFGFVPVRPSFTTLVPVANVPANQSAIVVRGFEPRDIDRIAELQRSCTSRRSWSVLRDADWWQWQKELWEAGEALAPWRFFSSDSDFIVAERGSDLVGYARLQLDSKAEFLLCTEVEMVPSDHEAAAALLAKMQTRAVAAERKVLRFPASRSIPFITQIFHVAAEHVVRPAAASMMCVLDLQALLDSMRGELSRRLQNSRFAAHSGRLVIGAGEQQVVVEIDRGQVASVSEYKDDADEGVEVAPKAAAEILAGYRSVEELRLAGQVEGGDADLALLAALFPAGEPFTWGADLLY